MRLQEEAFVLILILFAVGMPASRLFGQSDKPASGFGIFFSGYVKTDIFYDSRQTVNIREGHYLLYPKEPALDPLGRDVNAKASFNILSIQTRLAAKITGPDALGAKTSAYIEPEKTETVAGAEADFLKLVPRLTTASGYRTDESLTSLAGMAYLKVKRPRWAFKAEGFTARTSTI